MSQLFPIRYWSTKVKSIGTAWSFDRNPHRTEARRLMREGAFGEAEECLVQAIAEADLRGFCAAKRVRLRLDLAEAQRKQVADAEPDRAAALLEAAEQSARQAIALAAQTQDTVSHVQSLDALAEILAARNNWQEVEARISEAIRLSARGSHSDPFEEARRAHLMGAAWHWNGRPQHAVEALERALALYERAYGAHHLETGNFLTETGKIYRAQGEHAKAQECFRRAVQIHRVQLGLADPQVFEDLQHLAGSLQESGDLESAAEQYELALLTKERQLGVDNLDSLAEVQFSLANLYIRWWNLSRARELLAEAIGTFRRTGGPRLAVSYETLAQLEETSGRHFLALRELENAAKAWEKCGPARTRELVRNLEYRADLLDELRNPREAAWLREQARQRLQSAQPSLVVASHG